MRKSPVDLTSATNSRAGMHGGEVAREHHAHLVGEDFLARDLSAQYENAQFVVDVKSTGLYLTDPVLVANGAKTDYWKTGHSYIKRRVSELNALVGFEKSGHYFFNKPIGYGYDDALISAFAICDMLDRNPINRCRTFAARCR